MALIACPECQKSISDQSISCPQCGFPMSKLNLQINQNNKNEVSWVKQPKDGVKKDSPFSGLIVFIVVIIITFIILAKCSGTDLPTASDVSSIYESAKADTKYNETRSDDSSSFVSLENVDLETTAQEMIHTYENNEVQADAIYKDKIIKVTGIVSSINSDFGDEADVLLGDGSEYSFNDVHASGDVNFHNQAINLQKGQKVTLLCKGAGEVIGSPFLHECKFL
jgi:hypothetical protein